MKLNKLWASALALLALASCSKDLEPSANIIEPGQPTKTQLVHMNIKVTQDDNAMRVGYGVSDGDDGDLTGLAMVEKNVNLRIAVKQGLNGTPEIDTYSFDKVQGANLATFSGPIRIPEKKGDEPYYIAAVLVSEGRKENPDLVEYATVDDKSPTLVTFGEDKNNKPLLPNAENKIYPNIPYRSQWQMVDMNTEGTAIKGATLKLKPLGTLLRFRIHNTTTTNQDVTQLLFNMPSFTNKGMINFLASDVDNFPLWEETHAGVGIIYNLPTQITLNPDQKSGWYYVWVKSYAYPKDIRPETVIVQYKKLLSQAYVEKPIFKSRKALREGSVKVTFKIRDGVDAELDDLEDSGDWENSEEIYDWPGTVLRRLSSGVMNQAENGFVTDENTRNTNVAYYTFDEALQKFKRPVPIMVQGKRRRYSLPTVSEMRSIFPAFSLGAERELLVHYNVKELKVYKNVLERGITIGGVTQDYTSDFMNTVEKVVYAIRFKGTRNCTAFKYYVEGNAATNAVLRVKARLLGTNSQFNNLSLEQLKEDSFWTDPTGTYDVRNFPFYGSESGRITNPKLYEHNRRVSHWTSTRQTTTHVYFANINHGAANTSHTTGGGGLLNFPVFLFERK